MSILPRPLLLLLALRARASVRQLIARIRRPKGAAMAIVVVVVFGAAIIPGVLFGSSSTRGALRALPHSQVTPPAASEATAAGEREQVASTNPAQRPTPESLDSPQQHPVPLQGRVEDLQQLMGSVEFAPLLIVALLLLSIAGTPADRVLAFSPAEVDLLFPAPFARRQLLFYSMAKWVLPLLWVSLFFSLFLLRFGNSWLAMWLGLLLMAWFMNLVTLSAALIQQRIGQRRFRFVRRGLYVVALLGAAGASWWILSHRSLDPINAAKAVLESPAMRLAALPGVPFVRMMGAESALHAFAPWGTIVVGMNAALLVLALALDSNWLEQGADSSARVAAQIERVRQHGGFGAAKARLSGLALPMPPRFGGLGPMTWRQVVSGLRQAAGSLLVICLVLVGSLLPLAAIVRSSALSGRTASVFVFVAIGYITLFAPALLRMDFRGDIDRLPLLKSLPLPAAVVALAQVLPCALLVTAVQAVLALTALWLFGLHVPALPLWMPVLLAVNTVIVGLDNIAFLLWPHRPRGGPGLNLSGMQMVSQMLKFMLLGGCLLAAAAAALAPALLLDGPLRFWLAAAAALLVLTVESLLIILVVSAQFRRLDPDQERLADA